MSFMVTFESHEDHYDEYPSEFMLRQTQRACPDVPVRVYEWTDNKYQLREERPPLEATG